MNGVLFRTDVRRHRTSFIVWALILPLMSIFRMAGYPEFYEKYGSAKEALQVFSPAEVAMFGLASVDMTTITGYYGARVFSVLVLLGAVYLIMLGATILSKEEDDNTIEYLLVQPLSRTEIVVTKIAVVIFYTVALNIVLFLASWAMCAAFQQDGYSLQALVQLALGSLLVHLMFAAIGFLLSVFVVRSRVIYPLAIGISLGAYFLQMLANSSDSAQWLSWFSFFSYVRVGEATKGSAAMDLAHLLVSLFVIVGCFAAAVFVYRRKDISA